MGTILASLLDLQSVERGLSQVRARLKTRANAVAYQKNRIDQLRADFEALHKKSLERRKEADRLELQLRTDEDKVAKLRSSLSTARTNKEYATILTQLNTIKADNAKVEERAIRVLQDVDVVKGEADKVKEQISAEEKHLTEIETANRDEIVRLNAMLEELSAKRTEAAKSVSPKALTIFERLARSYDGDAMAVVERYGKKPPHDYVCGGCSMSLTAEHVNALRVRDEIRICDNCGRILYLETQKQNAPAE
ncbi:MAG TPA: C4-type zinc ribbon domain-containing protein [Phycisphaerae bacterium]|nr:C4-type zinc ribbon domain-containing protein [Phycisphaerae bacterium]